MRSGSAKLRIVFVRDIRLVISHAVRAGKDTSKKYRVVSSALDFEPNTFVVFIQIRTSRYLVCNIVLEVNVRIYMHIGTFCKGIVSPEFVLHSG